MSNRKQQMIEKALDIAARNNAADDAHHLRVVIDQMVLALTTCPDTVAEKFATDANVSQQRSTIQIITNEFILSGMSGAGGWSKKQLALIGVDWPPRHGWKDRVVGNQITDEDAEKFVALKKSKNSPSLF